MFHVRVMYCILTIKKAREKKMLQKSQGKYLQYCSVFMGKKKSVYTWIHTVIPVLFTGQLYFASKTELPSMTTNHCDYDTFQYILPDEYLI